MYAQFDGVWAWNDRCGQRRFLTIFTNQREIRGFSLADIEIPRRL
jgi:hypothetical protein